MKVPEIEVGILSAKEIEFHFNAPYVCSDNSLFEGDGKAVFLTNEEALLIINGEEKRLTLPAVFAPMEGAACFDLENVIIGIQFHWERKERQRFKGKLKLMVIDDQLTAVNILSLEDYLTSVISSEMSASSSLELLKSHAVISRSWLLAQKEKSQALKADSQTYNSVYESSTEYIRWYDKEDHRYFDVCADDHCQRYQGISKISSPLVEEAVKATFGQLLIAEDGKICDARFSKCCGGVSENFENVWEPVRHPYLKAIVDNDDTKKIPEEFHLTDEKSVYKFIKDSPAAFCNTKDASILSQVLNNYDQETQDFFRWKVRLTQNEISELIRRKTGWDFGNIIDLAPIERGVSGRIIRLKIVGTKKTLIIGKELFIRKALSESHLYSSAFIVEKEEASNLPTAFTLVGAGWGHGVGLCQIGAAVMGAKGYGYKAILAHYFQQTSLEKRY